MGKKQKTPDPQQVANAQYDANVKTAAAQAQMNRVNQETPYGTISYERAPRYNEDAYQADLAKYNQDIAAYNQRAATVPSIGSGKLLPNAKNVKGGLLGKMQQGVAAGKMPVAPNREKYRLDAANDTWTQKTTLTPEQQRIFDQQQQGITGQNDLALGMLGAITDSGMYSKPMDITDIPQQQYDVFDNNDPMGQNNQYIQQAQDAMYGLQTRYLDPQIAQQEDALNTRLVNQGLQPGTEAYNRAYNLFQTDRNRRYAEARDQATLSGNALAGDLFNRRLQAGQFKNQSIAQALQNKFNIRAQPLNELTGLLKGATVPTYEQSPQANFSPAGSFGDFYTAYKAQADAKNQAAADRIQMGLKVAGLVAAPFTGGASLAATNSLPVGTRLGGGAGGGTPWMNPDSMSAMQLMALG